MYVSVKTWLEQYGHLWENVKQIFPKKSDDVFLLQHASESYLTFNMYADTFSTSEVHFKRILH